MNRLAGYAGILGLTCGALAQVGTNCLDTLMDGGNRGANGGTVFFDLNIGPGTLSMTDIFLNNNAEPGADVEINVYTTVVGSGFAGNELDSSAWTLVGSGSGVSAGQGVPTLVILDAPIALDTGTTRGVAIELLHFGIDPAGHEYTDGDGSNETYANDDLRLTGGSATNGLFGPILFGPRVFNGWIFYNGGTVGCSNPPPPPPPCNAVEIAQMSVASSQIEMDALAVGPTTVSALNAAGTPGPADISLLETPANGAGPGVYDASNSLGNALASAIGTLSIIEGTSGNAAFDATSFEITFNRPHTEFGFEIGDWIGPVIVDLYDGANMVATVTTGTTALIPQFVQLRGQPACSFDRAVISVQQGGNFVLTQIWTQDPSACPCACNMDISTGPGVCDLFDFLAFQGGFVAGASCQCDIDVSTGPGVCDLFDFLAFQGAFVTGCP